MKKPSYPQNIILALSLIAGMVVYAFAQDVSGNRGCIAAKDLPENKKDTVIFKDMPVSTYFREDESRFTEQQRMARSYRNDGIKLQRIGKLDEALPLYQKAVQLDPRYAIAYNDMGIVYETRGLLDRAEDAYMQAIKVNPRYLSAYSNLAIFYENKHDLAKAAFYWKKRMNLGLPNDPWTVKATNRLEDIRLVLGEDAGGSEEQELLAFVRDVVREKSVVKKPECVKPKPKPKKSCTKPDNLVKSQEFFKNAQLNYKKGDYEVALKDAFNALALDPMNNAIADFVEKLQARLLSK